MISVVFEKPFQNLISLEWPGLELRETPEMTAPGLPFGPAPATQKGFNINSCDYPFSANVRFFAMNFPKIVSAIKTTSAATISHRHSFCRFSNSRDRNCRLRAANAA